MNADGTIQFVEIGDHGGIAEVGWRPMMISHPSNHLLDARVTGNTAETLLGPAAHVAFFAPRVTATIIPANFIQPHRPDGVQLTNTARGRWDRPHHQTSPLS